MQDEKATVHEVYFDRVNVITRTRAMGDFALIDLRFMDSSQVTLKLRSEALDYLISILTSVKSQMQGQINGEEKA